MSAIPPNIIGSVLQSGPAQQQQSRVDDATRNDQAARARAAASAPDAVVEIEAAEADLSIFADGGGLGGGGRDERHEEPGEEEAASPDASAGADPRGAIHIDIEA